MDLHDPAAVDPAKQKVTGIAERFNKEGGGLISIFYHPCEWVHREFWDGVNFARGANPPREQWKPPRQRTAEETEGAFRRFEQHIDHIRAIPGLRFVTATDLPKLYPDRVRTMGATANDLSELAEKLVRSGAAGVDFQVVRGNAYSLADQFELFTLAVGQLIDAGTIQFPIAASALLGPDGLPPAESATTEIPWTAFRDAALDVRSYLKTHGRIPARVFIGPDSAPPADYLIGLAGVYLHHAKNGALPLPSTVKLGRNFEALPARHVAKDTPNLFGGWVIHRAGFRAPKILEVARLQAWTLKPAVAGR